MSQVPGPAEDPRRRPGEDRRANRSTAGDSGGEHGDRRHRPSSRPAVAFRDGQDGRDGRDAASACQASSFQNLRSCKILQGLLQGLQSLERRLASSSFVSLSVQACTSENSLASERLTSVGASCAEAEVPSEEAALWRVSSGQRHELSLSLRLS